jgi:hypothetical protein
LSIADNPEFTAALKCSKTLAYHAPSYVIANGIMLMKWRVAKN